MWDFRKKKASAWLAPLASVAMIGAIACTSPAPVQQPAVQQPAVQQPAPAAAPAPQSAQAPVQPAMPLSLIHI